MSISVRCAGCGKQYQIQDSMAGKTAKCRCGHSFRVEAAANPPSQPNPSSPTQPAAGPPAQPNAAAEWFGGELAGGNRNAAADLGTLDNAPLPAASPLSPAASPPLGAPLSSQGTARPREGRSTWWKMPAILSAVWFLVVGIGGTVVTISYIVSHPIPGVPNEQRSAQAGGGIGTLCAIGMGAIWIVAVARRKKGGVAARKERGHVKAPKRAVVLGLVAGGVLAVLVGGYFVVRAIRHQAALRDFQEKMKSPEFREKFMGEKQGWQFYEDVGGGGFRVEVPGPPKTQFQTANSAAGPLRVVVTQAERGKDESFLISHTMLFLPDPTASLPLEPMAEAAVTNMKARVVSKRSFDFEGSPAVEADFQGTDRPFSGRAWFIMTKNRLYQVTWIASPPKPLNDEAKRFFASFKFALPPAPAAAKESKPAP